MPWDADEKVVKKALEMHGLMRMEGYMAPLLYYNDSTGCKTPFLVAL